MTGALHMKSILLILMFCILAIPASGERTTAKQAAIEWITTVDSGLYEESWALTGSIFQSQIDADSWGEMAAKARAPVGKLIARELADGQYQTALPGARIGDYIVFTFSSNFENLNPGTETITLVLEGGIWKVIGYNIR